MDQIKKKYIPAIQEALNNNTGKTISYSQYSIWKQCPHRWYNQYVLKLGKQPPNINTCFGTSMHEALQNYISIMYEKNAKIADNFDTIDFFKERLKTNYKNQVVENNNTHFSSPEELTEFYEDGVAILEWVKKHRASYFRLRKMSLVGIEVPILFPLDSEKLLHFKGFIDMVMYDEDSKEYYIYDIKTSTRGWKEEDKKDESKTAQILFYKHFYSQLFNVEEDKIHVIFYVVKRKIWEESEYPQKRVQEFSPTSGKNKMKRTLSDLNTFINDCFAQDEYIHKEYSKQPSNKCKWCPFNNSEHCEK